MIEIKMNGKQAVKIMDFYKCENFGVYYTPKNDQIKEYCKFLVAHYDFFLKSNYLSRFFKENVLPNSVKSENIPIICENEVLVFQFPDDYLEEELFYFKLKYC